MYFNIYVIKNNLGLTIFFLKIEWKTNKADAKNAVYCLWYLHGCLILEEEYHKKIILFFFLYCFYMILHKNLVKQTNKEKKCSTFWVKWGLHWRSEFTNKK